MVLEGPSCGVASFTYRLHVWGLKYITTLIRPCKTFTKVVFVLLHFPMAGVYISPF